jgi:hypothetical protein
VFTGNGGPPTTVVTNSGPFHDFGAGAAINDAGDIAFFADMDAGGDGIFTGPDPLADKVIREGDALFGSTATEINYFRGLNDDGAIAFTYVLANGRAGVAVAAVPEPTGVLVLAIATPILLSRRVRIADRP